MIELINVSKTYGMGENSVKALKNISMKIEDGDQIAIVGKSGSGKSTLLNILGGMDMPSEGVVRIDGEELPVKESKRAKYRREKLGFVFQFFYLIPSLSVYDNICLPLHLNHISFQKNKIVELAEQLEIPDKLSKYPWELSGGQQQRVSIARAIVHQPRIILADEPTGNLDSETAIDVMKLLLRYSRKNGSSLLLVTHDREIASMCSECYCMKDGRFEGE
jgi:putative ABC transport system ATP-binding protein